MGGLENNDNFVQASLDFIMTITAQINKLDIVDKL